MAKPNFIELGDGTRIPILYEDRAVLAIDKPAGWLLVPVHWRQTSRNLQAAIESSIASGAFWARARNLKFLRFVHRLDAETSGVLLLARSQGALGALSARFESREVEKRYLAVVHPVPQDESWRCRLPVGEDPAVPGRMRVDRQTGRDAETEFRLLSTRLDPKRGPLALIEAWPLTGRTHQIRVHLQSSGVAVVGDAVYGFRRELRAPGEPASGTGLALRAVLVAYTDPFTRRRVQVTAPCESFLRAHGFKPISQEPLPPP